MSNQWYYLDPESHIRQGPLTDQELKAKAKSGQIGPADLIWKEGMRDWAFASKVKGLFPGTSSANSAVPVDSGTGPVTLFTRQKTTDTDEKVPPTKTDPSPSAVKSPLTRSPGKKATASPPQATPPSASPPLSQTPKAPVASPADPFGFSPSASPDPFGIVDFGTLDALAQAAQSAPAILPPSALEDEEEEETPRSRLRTVDSAREAEQATNERIKRILWFAMPFAAALPIAFIVGCLNAFIPLFLSYFSIVTISGTAKGLGVIAGGVFQKFGFKNEVAALAYGGLLGIFSIYLFWAAYYYAQFNLVHSIIGMSRAAIEKRMAEREARDENGDRQGGVVVMGEVPEWAKPDPLPGVAMFDEEEEEAMDDVVEEAPPNEIAGVGPAEAPGDMADQEDDEEWEDGEEIAWGGNQNNNFAAQQKKFEMQLKDLLWAFERFEKGVTVFRAIWPFTLAEYVGFRFRNEPLWFHFCWFLEICCMIGVLAHSTWLVMLGHNPESSF